MKVSDSITDVVYKKIQKCKIGMFYRMGGVLWNSRLLSGKYVNIYVLNTGSWDDSFYGRSIVFKLIGSDLFDCYGNCKVCRDIFRGSAVCKLFLKVPDCIYEKSEAFIVDDIQKVEIEDIKIKSDEILL